MDKQANQPAAGKAGRALFDCQPTRDPGLACSRVVSLFVHD